MTHHYKFKILVHGHLQRKHARARAHTR